MAIQQNPVPPQQNIPKDVMSMNEADQKKWLEQRGYIPSERDGSVLWRHPETGVRYVFTMAIKLAIQDCRLPADFQLAPDLKRRRLDETVTDGGTVDTAAPKV